MSLDTIITLILTIFGAGVGFGKIRQRLTHVETALAELKAAIAALAASKTS
jgi:hypothetical protein